MSTFRADLHIHSCLSPCGDLSASPNAIASAALSNGMDIIALTDHNSSRNIPSFEQACRREGIAGVYGIEVTTREEVHVLVLFGSAEEAVIAGDEIYERLESSSFNPEHFGDQVWVNSRDEIEGNLEKLLILGATDFSIDSLTIWCREKGGIVIPAHIDRPSFGAISQLGMLPDAPFNAVETTKPLPLSVTDRFSVVCNSDAHRPEMIGSRYFHFHAESASFDDLRKALDNGRVYPVFPNS